MQNQQSPLPPSTSHPEASIKTKKTFLCIIKTFFDTKPDVREWKGEKSLKKYEKIINKLFFLFLSHTLDSSPQPSDFLSIFLCFFFCYVHSLWTRSKEKHTENSYSERGDNLWPSRVSLRNFYLLFWFLWVKKKTWKRGWSRWGLQWVWRNFTLLFFLNFFEFLLKVFN